MSRGESITRRLLGDPCRLLLEMAQQRSGEELFRLVVERLASSPAVALARIWRIAPGDICGECPMRAECPDRSRCLHLVASGGRSLRDGASWQGVDGHFRRFPIGIRKIGRIAASGEALNLADLESAPEWVARPEWIAAEGVRSFSGKPLLYRGEVLGVLGLFSRERIDQEACDWLQIIADHAATALANVRAWEEIEGLKRRLELENAYLQEEIRDEGSFGSIVGRSPPLQSLAQQISLVAPTDAAVLILGESGTGKELAAREIHQRSRRAGRPLIKVNCAAIPRELFDSEFFGHAKGSFTGALRDRVGRFELADGGTLFLDEIGEIPLDLQSKLLRVLQEGELERVGDERTRKVDVRIIAATNRDLKAASAAGLFRSDLYYRLGVFPLQLPPLRERRDDLPLLAEHFLRLQARRLGRPVPALTPALAAQLQAYSWPGNIRELQHVLERALITAGKGPLRLQLGDEAAAPAPASPAAPPAVLSARELKKLAADNLRRALDQCEGRIYGPDGAAALLGLKPTTLASQMKSAGLELKTSVRRKPG
ncbi:MAG: Formate hydrogenlyase transcriptional activator [Verrucomicrobiota bacterium]|jgi:transcriptional regulator with GAF, ATPase, and Fis domain